MQYTFKSYVREFGHIVFNVGVGMYLIEAKSVSIYLSAPLTFFIVFAGLLATAQYSAIAGFWSAALKNRDKFGPGAELYEHGVVWLDRTCTAVLQYRHKETYWLSVFSSLILMAGLMEQNLWLALGVEAVSSVVGYSVIRAFLTHFPMYYKLVEGKELENA